MIFLFFNKTCFKSFNSIALHRMRFIKNQFSLKASVIVFYVLVHNTLTFFAGMCLTEILILSHSSTFSSCQDECSYHQRSLQHFLLTHQGLAEIRESGHFVFISDWQMKPEQHMAAFLTKLWQLCQVILGTV